MDRSSDRWKRAVIYQIYPRSFCDSNGDGIGDIPGILSKLDYLEYLGADALWLSPVYPSPQYDNGYDVADYQGVDPIFGTMSDLERLIDAAGKRGIRIIMDLVLNHSSDEHPWFRKASQSREDPCHDYYIWRDRVPGDAPGQVSFGYGSWKWVPEVGQYYYYQFSEKQPDLNWANPALRQELYSMINWWVDKGVGGFRLDVVDHLGKDPERQIKVNGPHLHELIREMSAAAFRRPGLVTVGEAWSATTDSAQLYSAPDGSELSMVFQFEHILLDQTAGGDKWDLAPLPLPRLKQVLAKWQHDLHKKGWNSLFWENHDLPRIVSRWGDDSAYRELSAKMLAVLLFSMEGTPYIYQGQELGMTNIQLDMDEYQDVETLNMFRDRRLKGWTEAELLRAAQAKSRDNARTPMQWSAGVNAGFSAGEPWLKVNPNYPEINAESQVGRAGSVFECYRRLIRLRREYPIFTDGDFELLLPEDGDVFAFTRSDGTARLLAVCNFHGRTQDDPLAEQERGMTLLYGNYGDDVIGARLRPYEARLFWQPLTEGGK